MNNNAIKQEILTDIRKAASVHFLYPEHEIKFETAIPKGYEPFYISHLGRHGSRYLIDNQDLKLLAGYLSLAKDLNVLTSNGLKLQTQLAKILQLSLGRDGDLSEKGVRQQRAIATRMFNRHETLFTQPLSICARSTVVPRCMLSMMAFCDQLKTLNPNLNIRYDAGEIFQTYLNYHTQEAIAYREDPKHKAVIQNLEIKYFKFDRLMKSLFNSDVFISGNFVPIEFMKKLYNVASIVQNLDTEIDLLSYFTEDELFDIWRCKNYEQYVLNSNAQENNRIMFGNAKPLLTNIIESAEEIIQKQSTGAHIRFAHDGNLIPLAMILHLDGCFESEDDPEKYYQTWQDYRVTPMAGNVQMVFYRQTSGNHCILVKFLLNENEITVPLLNDHLVDGIYYPWPVLKDFYLSLLNESRELVSV